MQTIIRSSWLHVMALAMIMGGAGHLHAQGTAYPAKPIRLIYPFPPGGGADFVGRLIATKLAEAWGQQIINENRSGAGGNIGAELALRSPPDGYTMLVITGSYTVNPSVYKVPFDSVNDVTPLAQTANGPFVVVVHPALPAKNVRELVAITKARPGALNYGSTGVGGITHLATEYFRIKAGIQITHIPYKGTGPAVVDLLGGQVQLMIAAGAGVMHHVRANRLRALAVTSPKRSQTLPDLPTVIESGVPGYDVLLWYGLLGPKGLPKEIVAQWNTEVNRAIQLPDIKERFASAGLDASPGTPEDLGRQLRSEVDRWAMVVKQAGVKVE